MGLSWGEREGGRYPDAIPFASGRRAPLFDAASEACEQERKATKPYSAIRARASAFGTEALRCRPPGARRWKIGRAARWCALWAYITILVVCLPRRQVPSGDCNSTGPLPPPLLLLLLLPSLSPIHSITTTQQHSPQRRAGWLSQHPAPSHRTALIVGAGDMQTRDMASCPLGCLQLVAASARYLFLPPRLNSSIRSASNCDAIRRVLPSSRQCSVGMYMMYH